MGLFGGGRKNRRFTGQTGVFITPQGLSLAHVVTAVDGQARLERCETLSLPAADAERSFAEGVRRLELENTATVAVMEQGSYHLLQTNPRGHILNIKFCLTVENRTATIWRKPEGSHLKNKPKGSHLKY